MSKAIRPFDQIIREIQSGGFNDELTDTMTEVVNAVRRSGKAGKISVTLQFKPRGDSNQQFEVVPTVKGVIPEPGRPITLFFVNDDDGLQRDDPRQHDLGLRMSGPATETENKESSNG